MEKVRVERTRTFVAIKLPDHLKKEIGKIQRQIKTEAPGTLHLVPPDQLHITIAFLGRLSWSTQTTVISVCQQIANQTPSFELTLGQLGVFPRPARPSIVWIGLENDSEKLVKLINTVTKNLENRYINPIRGSGNLIPHIAIGRVDRKTRTHKLVPLRNLLQNFSINLTGFKIPAKQIIVYTSNLTKTGHRHIPVATISLVKSSLSPN